MAVVIVDTTTLIALAKAGQAEFYQTLIKTGSADPSLKTKYLDAFLAHEESIGKYNFYS